jgi:hypothetical protein
VRVETGAGSDGGWLIVVHDVVVLRKRLPLGGNRRGGGDFIICDMKAKAETDEMMPKESEV